MLNNWILVALDFGPTPRTETSERICRVCSSTREANQALHDKDTSGSWDLCLERDDYKISWKEFVIEKVRCLISRFYPASRDNLDFVLLPPMRPKQLFSKRVHQNFLVGAQRKARRV